MSHGCTMDQGCLGSSHQGIFQKVISETKQKIFPSDILLNTQTLNIRFMDISENENIAEDMSQSLSGQLANPAL